MKKHAWHLLQQSFGRKNKSISAPKVDAKVIELFSDLNPGETVEMGEEYTANLKNKLQKTDLSVVARRFNGTFDGSKLTLKVLGKDFSITRKGEFKSDIHVNRFVTVPFLELVVNGKGLDPKGHWVSFRELKETAGFSYDFFHKRCELIMKRIADSYPDLFEDLVHIFWRSTG